MNFTLPTKLSFLLFALFLILNVRANVFNTPRQISLPTAQAAVATADLNRDGLPDLITGGDPFQFETGKIRVLLGKGNGNFHPFQEYAVGYDPNEYYSPFVEKIIVGDVNADGNLDVAVAHNGVRSQEGSNNLLATVLLGDGQGNLHSSKSYYFHDNENTAVRDIDFTDFNLDGKIDIVVGGQAAPRGKIFGLRNIGNGNFQPIGPKTIGAGISRMQTVFANNDANPDLIMATEIGILILYGDGGFYGSESQLLDRDVFSSGMVISDFNSDGKFDIAVVEQYNPRIRVFLSNESGYPTTPLIYQTAFTTNVIKSDDFNRDGKKDLIIVNGLGGEFQIFYCATDGTFNNPK